MFRDRHGRGGAVTFMHLPSKHPRETCGRPTERPGASGDKGVSGSLQIDVEAQGKLDVLHSMGERKRHGGLWRPSCGRHILEDAVAGLVAQAGTGRWSACLSRPLYDGRYTAKRRGRRRRSRG